MLVLNKEAALDHVISRSLRASEVVPEHIALHEPLFSLAALSVDLESHAPYWRDAAETLAPIAAGAVRYTAAASGSGAAR
jgi:hypothetical protein